MLKKHINDVVTLIPVEFMLDEYLSDKAFRLGCIFYHLEDYTAPWQLEGMIMKKLGIRNSTEMNKITEELMNSGWVEKIKLEDLGPSEIGKGLGFNMRLERMLEGVDYNKIEKNA